MDRILIADDEKEIRLLLKLYLENEGYEVAEAGDGEEALKVMAEGNISLCLLDIMMPKLDGFHVLQKLREISNIPVIIISAKDADPEKILGLNLGADDYMVKPFNPLEAVARVRSNLRRYHSPSGDAQERAHLLKHKDLTLDLDACSLKKGEREIELTSVEYRIMTLFLEHPGWGEEFFVADNNIMVCISKLRAKLDEDPNAYIKTIRGLGYRLEKN